ncbi:hypothetical protein B9S53_03820 [Arthrospira sp. O9.13F]|nr:hypothetical protein B9S53_03820 [Arthrospira sp. O9.13F]
MARVAVLFLYNGMVALFLFLPIFNYSVYCQYYTANPRPCQPPKSGIFGLKLNKKSTIPLKS